tara:strand:+ start:1565 stop:2734 length:1170 start_codon:yes stop_codon:yes gene_type:complete
MWPLTAASAPVDLLETPVLRGRAGPDIAVVGGGPAGLTAATIAAQAGASVVVLDRFDWPGGMLGLQTQPLQGPGRGFSGATGLEIAGVLASDVRKAGAEVRSGVNVTAVAQHPKTSPTRLTWSVQFAGSDSPITAQAVVLATGSTEPLPRFDGSDLNGVMRAGDAQAALNIEGRRVGDRIVVVGSDNSGLLIAQNLLDAGAEVLAIVDESPQVEGRELNAAPLRDRGVEMLTSTRVVRAIGHDRLERVRVRSLAEEDGGRSRELGADALLFALRRFPDATLADSAGCPALDIDVLGGPTPVHDGGMATTKSGLFVCGDAAGVESGAVALETGRVAGLSAAVYLGFRHPLGHTVANQARGRLGFLRRGRRGGHRRTGIQALHREHRDFVR